MTYTDHHFRFRSATRWNDCLAAAYGQTRDTRRLVLLGPARGHGPLLDEEGNEVAPAAGDPAFYYVSVRYRGDLPDPNPFAGLESITPEEAAAVVGTWA